MEHVGLVKHAHIANVEHVPVVRSRAHKGNERENEVCVERSFVHITYLTHS